MKDPLILASILALLTAGLFIALHSGNVNLTTRNGRQAFFDNLSSLLFRVIAYLAGLFMVQRFVGFPIDLPW